MIYLPLAHHGPASWHYDPSSSLWPQCLAHHLRGVSLDRSTFLSAWRRAECLGYRHVLGKLAPSCVWALAGWWPFLRLHFLPLRYNTEIMPKCAEPSAWQRKGWDTVNSDSCSYCWPCCTAVTISPSHNPRGGRPVGPQQTSCGPSSRASGLCRSAS